MRVTATIGSTSPGARLSGGDYSVYTVSAPLVLLYGCAVATTIISWLAGLRAARMLSLQLLLIVPAAAIGLAVAVATLRIYIRELLRTLAPRERAMLFFVHVIFAILPQIVGMPRLLELNLLSLQVPLLLFLVERQHFVRLFSVQLATMLVAGIVGQRDDLESLAAVGSFVALLVLASVLMRAAFVAEEYETAVSLSIARLVRTAWRPLLLVLAVTLAGWWALPGTRLHHRPSFGWSMGDRADRNAPPSDEGGQAARLVRDAVILGLALLLLAWFVDRVRRAFSRRPGEETPLDYMAAEAVLEGETGVAEIPRHEFAEARRRIVDAYAGLLTHVGKRFGARRRGQTAREYELEIVGEADWGPLGDELDRLTAVFQGARYRGEDLTLDAAAAYEADIERLRTAFAQRFASAPPRLPPTTTS